MHVDESKGTVDTDMLLNNNLSADGAAGEEQESQNPGEEDSAQENITLQDETMPQQEEPLQEMTGNVEKSSDVESANGRENKTSDLDIESMLAAIHHDNSTNNGNAQNLV